jgi:hypothetical protein
MAFSSVALGFHIDVTDDQRVGVAPGVISRERGRRVN